ncbi:MAG: hypothetical protein OXN20_21955 [Gemmatimonadota bacterium]|nr:hypothetical protein [Gemmatimonadota bacterium]MDE2832792.1 hypothetical protein [Gemmatimonadota bacterium]
MKLQAGAATSNITPWLGVTMPGSFHPRYGEDVHDELLAKALVIDNGDVRIAMVTCDLIAVPEAIVNAVKARIQERCGISPECVMVNATHTHSGAGVSNLLGVGEDEGYTTWLPLKVADAVELAVKRMQPARAGFASVMEDRISFYRRWLMKDGTVRMNPGLNNPDLVRPMGEIDPELAMMYVEGVDGTPISVVASFSLHYVGTGSVGEVSADYFGQFFNLLRHYIGGNCVPILWNAASGQINNNDYSGERIWRDRGHPRARRMANVLAGHVLTEIQLMDLNEELALEAVTGTLEFSRKVITETDLDIAEQILAGGYDYEEGPFSWVVGQPVRKERVGVYARQCQRLAALPEQMTAPVQAIRLGDAAILALPGEIFVETGLRIKAQTSASPLMLVSLANGSIGYVCTDEALTQEGGYETWASLSSLGGVGTVPAMESLSLSLLERLGFGG